MDDVDMRALTADRLPLFTLAESRELLEVLEYFGAFNSGWGDQARRFACQLAASVPSSD